MANDQRFDSRYTGEEMENAFSVALAIANHAGIPKGTGNGSIQILSMDTDKLTGDGERIPTSAAVVQAIAASRKVSELLTFKGIVQTADDLPEDAKPGFVYIVEQEDNENYAWDGVRWTPIGKLIAPIVLSSQSVSYQISDSGDSVPTGEWVTDCPEVQHGKYLWTRTVVQFSVGDPITSYSCAYAGVDGREITVSGVSPDETGNVTLTAADVGALPVSGGDMEGAINMNGQPISGLNDPTEDTQAARKGYVDAAKTAANAYTDAAVRKAAPRNLLDNSDFRNPVNQRGVSSGALTDWKYFIDRWRCVGDCTYELTDGGIRITGGAIVQSLAKGARDNGKTYTFAACLSTGTIRILTYTLPETVASEWVDFSIKEYSDVRLEAGGDSSNYNVVIRKMSDCTIEWAALYEGEYTAETLPEYHPKGYGAELAECQRYYQAFLNNAFLGTVVVSSDGVYFQGSIPCGEMRVISPTIIGSIAAWDGLVSNDISSVTSFKSQGNGMRINGSLSSNVTQGKFLILYAKTEVAFSADL